jgi:RNA polymerase sigma factor (sigma-70 family)
MVEVPEIGREDSDPRNRIVVVTTSEVEAWFVREVLPLEAVLMRFLRHNWRDKSDIEDLRQEIYARVFNAARSEIPQSAKSFVFRTARNLLINEAQKANVIPIDTVADLESLGIELDAPAPDRNIIARQELRKLQDALDQLPPRHREAVVLGRIQGLSGREIAARMGIAESTASDHLRLGMHALTDLYLRGTPNPRRQS